MATDRDRPTRGTEIAEQFMGELVELLVQSAPTKLLTSHLALLIDAPRRRKRRREKGDKQAP